MRSQEYKYFYIEFNDFLIFLSDKLNRLLNTNNTVYGSIVVRYIMNEKVGFSKNNG